MTTKCRDIYIRDFSPAQLKRMVDDGLAVGGNMDDAYRAEAECRRRLAHMRRTVFECTDGELVVRHREMDRLKRIMGPVCRYRRERFKEQEMTRLGY